MAAMTYQKTDSERYALQNQLSKVWCILGLVAGAVLLLYGLSVVMKGVGAASADERLPDIIIGGLEAAFGGVILFRYIKLAQALFMRNELKHARHIMTTDIVQVVLLLILAFVLFPVIWILAMSLDPRDLSRPQGLTLIPPGASFAAYEKVLNQPSPNPVSFARLLLNSIIVAGGTSAFAVIIGTSAAYAFSRLRFPGREIGMLGFVLVLMIPPGGTLAPLFVLLNPIRQQLPLLALIIAFTSSALPFAIWNMKGFIDSLPYDLEEAAQIDGCTRAEGFIRVILPLALPGIAVTALMSFLTGWSEFVLSWTFLSTPDTFTLPMVLRGMIGQYASGTSWATFAAMAIVVSIPPVMLFFVMQRYLVGGLSVGGVKG